ncbi:MAG: MFS transporter [Chloroflexi bacterium]|nr:MFS transporter [Chloroflexota bacterium]
MSSWAATTFDSLRYRHYRVLWIGTSLSFLVFMMSSVVQSVVAYDLTGRNGAVGFVSLGMGVATILVAPFGGVIADRVSKKRLLLIGQVLIGLNFAAVGVLIITGQITIFFLAASTFVLGTVFSFIAPARQAWIGELLPKASLPNGIALQQVAMTGTRIFGPFLAGGLVALAFVGSGGTYLFMGALFAVVVATLARLPSTTARSGGRKVSVMGDMMLGVRHMRERPRLMLLAVSFIGIVIAGFSYQVVLPGYLQDELHHSPKNMALMLGVSAISGLAVTIAIAGMAGSRHAWRLMLGGGILMGASLLLMAGAPNLGFALLTMLLMGAGTSAFQLINNALVMQEASPEFHGRVMSVTMLAWGANGLAGLPFGVFADHVGERETLFLMGLLVLVVTGGTALLHATLVRRAPPPAVPVGSLASGD